MKNKRFNNEEKVLKILQDKYNNSKTKTNRIPIYKTDFSTLDLSENEIVKSLYVLKDSGMIDIIRNSVHNDFSVPWDITLKAEGIYYFNNKKQKKKLDKREWVRTYLPVTISTIALIKSFLPEITSLIQAIIQLYSK